MKFKKLISTVLLSAALVGGGLTHAKTVDAALNKKQAIAIVNNKRRNQPVANTFSPLRLKVVSKNWVLMPMAHSLPSLN
ncbi:hypothetical protein SDC49_25035 [Lactobacillus sp. R2/2]|nr:hypothetical protein [Lactobacillus sp. R2/2]